MARVDASVILYAVDLEELRRWVGSKDEKALQEALTVLRDDEDTEWDPEEMVLLERLLRRVVMEGRLYEGLPDEERYYLNQLLIDLFDEYVSPDPLTEDLPLAPFVQAVDGLRGGDAGRMASWIVRGRELDGEGLLWTGGPVEEFLSFMGYVTRDEAPAFVAALDAAMKRTGPRPSGLLKQLRSAAEECARAELDLVSFVG